jgi:ribonuclease R
LTESGPQDPYAAREAANYENPVASRELILEVLESSSGPMSHTALCQHFGLEDEDSVEALRRRLLAMERDGQVIRNRRGAYGRVDKMDLVRGRVQGHRDGFGFVIPADGSQDIYLANRQMRKVFDRDEVLVRLEHQTYRGKREGAIVEVLARNTHQLVGRLSIERGVHLVKPDNPRVVHDILIPSDQPHNAHHGQFVVAEIIEQPNRRTMPAGRIVEVLGDHLAPGMEIDVAIRSHGVPHEWPQAVLDQAAAIKPQVSEEDKVNRIDLRDLPLVTIDGEDARDFDDAVYCEPRKEGGWRLYVAIADVSHYVSVESALDKEAQNRGNSVYFPDFVVPMLPEVLSNGLCSLNPEVDRLCMVCEMTIAANGGMEDFQFFEGLMHSKARLTYNQVGQVIAEQDDENSGIRKSLHHVVPHLDELYRLYRVLRKAREARGAIDFETQETRILFDKNRKIQSIVPVVRNDAHKLIEECMLAANVCAAHFLEELEVPCLYRIHEGPKAEKIDMLLQFLGENGLTMTFSGDEVTPGDYQEVLQSITGRPDAHLIQTVMLRSMNQAVYAPQNKGHFGLAYEAYTHFTSPIRRYPDLLVHRAIRSVVRSNVQTKRVRRHPDAQPLPKDVIYPYQPQHMSNFGEQCSMTERRADDATRDVISWLKCEYLQDKVGEVFEGIVSSVVGFGLFVELKDVYVEGLVHITGLPQDYYHFDAAHHRLIGERTSQVFRLGDQVTVQVARVDLDERKVDLELVAHEQSKGRKGVKASERAKELADEFEKERERRSPRRGKGKGGKTAKSGGAGGAGGTGDKAAAGGGARKPRKRPARKGRGAGARDASLAAGVDPAPAAPRAAPPEKARPQKKGEADGRGRDSASTDGVITRFIKKLFRS